MREIHRCRQLGHCLGAIGQACCLVGADLRKPVLHQIFDIPNLPGLTGYLTDNIPLERIIAPSKIVDGLDLMPSGPIPPNPAELLQSQKNDGSSGPAARKI